jgi:polyketide cyclase/dehydrase/lipid transport protein
VPYPSAMPTIRAQAATTAPREVLWQLVRSLAERMRFLPDSAFRNVEGDTDHATFELRNATGWTNATSSVVRVVEGEEIEEHAAGQGVSYTATFHVGDGLLSATVDYAVSGIPGFVERTMVRPVIERSFADGLRAIADEAERRAAAG